MARVAGTPASTMAASDQSAEILDFDCIYTHDVQRKRQKRWHDGFLRFHAFNRRVMVYDVPRNFIGDTHLRDADTLQDGDEVQLDRGVLVEVGESRGTSRQDVTPLFEKKRPQPQRAEANEAPIPRPTYSSPPISSSSLLQPKSLNIVLGPRRGLQGRAVLAKNSPYEQTKRPEVTPQSHEIERPTKRPRIEGLSRGPTTSRRNTEDQFEIRKASTLLSGDRHDRPLNIDEPVHQRKLVAPRKQPNPLPPQDRSKSNTVSIPASAPNSTPDTAFSRVRESTLANDKDRVTSKLKVSASRRPKLMCLQASASKQKSSVRPELSEPRKSPKRRAPLRISAMDQSSSPTSANFTIMDFPTTQDIFAESTPLPLAKTLDELDRELLESSPALPQQRPVLKTAPMAKETPHPPLQPAAAPPADLPAPRPADPGLGTSPSRTIPTWPPPHAVADSKPLSGPPTVSSAAAPLPPPPARASVAGPKQALGPHISLSKKPHCRFAPVVQRPVPNKLSGHEAPPQAASAASRVKTSAMATTAMATTAKTTTLPPAPEPVLGPSPALSPRQRPRKQSQPQPQIPQAAPVSVPGAEADKDRDRDKDKDIGPWSRTAFDLFGFELPARGGKAAAAADEIHALKKRVTAIRGSVRGMMREYCD